MTSFSERMGRYLHREESSIPRLAQLTGVPVQTLKNWVAGKTTRPRSRQALLRVAEALHLSPAEREELLLSGGHSPERVGTAQILRAIPGREAAVPHPIESRTASVPFQVPMALPTFVGRQLDLIQLERCLRSAGTNAVLCLQGMPGSGKTALAAELCTRLRSHYTDGILWARLDTTDAAGILKQFADALDIQLPGTASIEICRSLVLGHVYERQLLLVLDGAAIARQVRPLLPAPGAKAGVLVTTRNDLHLSHALTYRVYPFEPRESLVLFERFLGPAADTAQSRARSDIAHLVGHLPLALAIVAGHLAAEEPGLHAVHRTLAKLRRAPTRLALLERDDLILHRSLSVSLESLSVEQRVFFNRLRVLGLREYRAAAAAAVTKLPVAETEVRLDWLAERSLIERTPLGGWRFHPLLLTLARELALAP